MAGEEVSPEEAMKLPTKQRVRLLAPKVFNAYAVGIYIYAMATFQVGMFKKPSLGLKMLGYDVSGWFGPIFSLQLLSLACFLSCGCMTTVRVYSIVFGETGHGMDPMMGVKAEEMSTRCLMLLAWPPGED